MTISLYSFVMATLWFTVFILLGALLQRKAGFLFCYQLTPLLLLLALTVFRLAVPIEVPFAQVICSTAFYPAVRDFLYTPLISAISVAQVLLIIWVIVAALLCIRLSLHIRRDIRSLNSVSALPCPNVKRCLNGLVARRGRVQRVRLVVSPDIPTPMVTGFFKPTICLPSECTDLSEEELECILSHELCHLSSGDIWVKLVIRLLCCLMWWNPCVYLLRRNLDSALEYKCDLAVTRAMGTEARVAYSQTLLTVLRQLADKAPILTQTQTVQARFCGVAETTVLKRRFQLLLEDPDPRARPTAMVFMAALLVLFVISYSVVFQPASKPPTEDLSNAISISPETSYILKSADGTYYLIYEGIRFGEILPDDLQDRPVCFLTIKNEEGD